MSETVVIKASDFLFMSRFVSTEETRFYLRGVFVHAAANGDLMLASTDGHRLGLMRLSKADGEVPTVPAAGFILGATKALITACKGKPARHFEHYMRVTDSAVEIVEANSYQTAHDIVTIEQSFPLASCIIDGTFPEYARIVPSECSGKMDGISYNPAYLASFGKPGKHGDGAVCLLPSGEAPALVTNTDTRFLGVLMPIRTGKGQNDPMTQRNAVLDGPAPAAKEKVAS